MLKDKARWVRRQVLEMIVSANKGHIGGSFSCIDILVALYYGGILGENDKFILSKGHACAALYVILADLGYFPISELATFCQKGSRLEGHPRRGIPGIEVNTGSLGHGLGIGTGLALGDRTRRVYVLLSDGECYEGSTWEAAIFAAHHKLTNLVGIIDRNQQTVLGFTEEYNKLEPLAHKWGAFGWAIREISGHNFDEILFALNYSRYIKVENLLELGRPLMIIANTVKGKGVSFMEKNLVWHTKVPNAQELELMREELSGH